MFGFPARRIFAGIFSLFFFFSVGGHRADSSCRQQPCAAWRLLESDAPPGLLPGNLGGPGHQHQRIRKQLVSTRFSLLGQGSLGKRHKTHEGCAPFHGLRNSSEGTSVHTCPEEVSSEPPRADASRPKHARVIKHGAAAPDAAHPLKAACHPLWVVRDQCSAGPIDKRPPITDCRSTSGCPPTEPLRTPDRRDAVLASLPLSAVCAPA